MNNAKANLFISQLESGHIFPLHTGNAVAGAWVVYFLHAPRIEAVKIGVTRKNPEDRLKSFRSTLPFTVELLGWTPGGYPLERAAHFVLRDAHINGEWFDTTHPVVRDVLGSFDIWL